MDIKDIAGLEKPATELINRVSDAVGGIAKPWQMKRVAKAEVEIKKLHALADIEITEQRERALKRMILEEEKNQENIEAVTAKAIPHLKGDSKPHDLDEDFLRFLFERAKFVSNADMQQLWGRILASEANSSGTFSRRTMDIVAQMSRDDASLFLRFCQNVWWIGSAMPMISEEWPLESQGGHVLSFQELAHLDDMGLINFDNFSGFVTKKHAQKERFHYYGCVVEIEFGESSKEDEREVRLGPAVLTRSGKELISVVEVEKSKDAFEWGMQSLVKQGIRVSLPIESKGKYPGGASS
ncbi:DUF2806 domain-containing protein [Agrobacterium sp. 22-221-1]